MAESAYLHRVVRKFEDFVASYGNIRSVSSVELLLLEWLAEGDGVKDCANNRTIFFAVATLVLAEWHDDTMNNGSSARIPRHIKRARTSPGDYLHGSIFDEYFFETAKDGKLKE
ncbi:hypothetical protein IOD16_30880 [Saccharothrix sp. 6-C]|uniref:hypothetical protein n=1 Tax=Saccharothrix sp. 6-C TaxID=2781735 RepID=UPI0019171E59|nr:hypothetical protein [Saccharothrix sp. 6-C]QQQ75459.1 hypothetical protein IOD16_30880 [Saccharothrix sp. 6-C]